MIKKILMMLVMVGIFISFASAVEFYSGSTYIYSLDSTIEITNEKAFVVSDYIFKGDDKVDVNFVGLPSDAVVEFDGKIYSKEFSINPNGKKIVKVSYEFEIGIGDIQSFKYSPNPTFDGKLYSEEVNHYLKVVAPSYLDSFTSMSREYNSLSQEDGKNIFIWDENTYLTPLILKWNTLDFDISVMRKLPDVIEDIFEVEITIKNNGDEDITNLLLEDNFLVNQFESVSPAEEFTIDTAKIESIVIDTRLYWRKTISLSAGETKTIFYKLKSLGMTEQNVFNPLVVKYNNIVIASTEEQTYYNNDVKSLSKINLVDLNPTPSMDPLILQENYEEMIEKTLMEEENFIKEMESKSNPSFSSAINIKEKNNWFYFLMIFLVVMVIVIYFLKKGKKDEGEIENNKSENYPQENLQKGKKDNRKIENNKSENYPQENLQKENLETPIKEDNNLNGFVQESIPILKEEEKDNNGIENNNFENPAQKNLEEEKKDNRKIEDNKLKNYPQENLQKGNSEPQVKNEGIIETNMLNNFVQENLQKGYSETQIKNALLKEGWPKESIEKSFTNLKGGINR